MPKVLAYDCILLNNLEVAILSPFLKITTINFNIIDGMIMQENLMAEIIKTRLKEKDWKAADLARHANVPPATISRIVNGSEQVSIENIYKILKSLDLLCEPSGSLVVLKNDKDSSLNEFEEGLLKLFRKLNISQKVDIFHQISETVKKQS